MKVNKPASASKNVDPQHELFTAIAELKTINEIKLFFEDLCTPNELQAMADRWIVVAYVKAGKSYREIHKKTGVSLTTIGRVARFLAYGSGGYDLVFERLYERKTNAKRKVRL